MTDAPSDDAAGLRALAEKHGVSLDAVRHMLQALDIGGGRMAQFSHPDFGGMGQWSAGGMVMVGSMNDYGLKARVSALCEDLSAALPELRPRTESSFAMSQSSGGWWPEGLGRPSSVGSQNSTRYAWFPESRRLAVETNGRVALYDTGEHVISGASQQQSGSSSFRFSGPHGVISLDDLTPVGPAQAQSQSQTSEPPRAERAQAAPPAPEPRPAFAPSHSPSPVSTPRPARPAEPPRPAAAVAPAASHAQTDVISTLERLAELHRKGILTDEEFSGKKAELLARL